MAQHSDLADFLQENGLDKKFWLPKFLALGLDSKVKFQYVDSSTCKELEKQKQYDWERGALQTIFKLDVEEQKQQEDIKKQRQEMKSTMMQDKDQHEKRLNRIEKVKQKDWQVPHDSWTTEGKSQEKIDKLKKVHDQLQEGGQVTTRKQLKDNELLQKVSGGRALKGLLLTKSLAKDQLDCREAERLLETPEHVELDIASERKDCIEHFNSVHQVCEYRKKAQTLGVSASASASISVYANLTIGGSGSIISTKTDSEEENTQNKTSIRLSTMKHYTVHLASYTFQDNDLKLCASARKDLKELCMLSQVIGSKLQGACEKFFWKYGSHFSKGPLQFGGHYEWMCTSECVEFKEKETVKGMQISAISSSLQASFSGIGIGCDLDIEKTKGSYKGKCNEQALDTTRLEVNVFGGPQEAPDLGKWNEGLAKYNSTWILTDRGTRYIAVWDIIRMNYEEEFGDISEVLRNAWEKMTGLKAEPIYKTNLPYDSQEVLKEVSKWEFNETSLPIDQVIEYLKYLVKIRQDIITATLNPKIWRDQYLSTPLLQAFLMSLVTTIDQESPDIDYVKSLVHQLIDQELGQLVTMRVNFPRIRELSQWLQYDKHRQLLTSSSMHHEIECADVEEFIKYLGKIIEDLEITDLNNRQLQLEGGSEETQAQETFLTRQVSIVLCTLRSHYQKTYDDIFIRVLVYPLQSGDYDDVITLKTLTLNSLKNLHHQFLSKREVFCKFTTNLLQLQAFLFSLALKIGDEYQLEDEAIVLQIRQMIRKLNPPENTFEEKLQKEVNLYLMHGSTKERFKNALQIFMTPKPANSPVVMSTSAKPNNHSLIQVLKTTVNNRYETSDYSDDQLEACMSNNPIAHRLFKRLDLCQHYPKTGKLGLQDALCIRHRVLQSSLKLEHTSDTNQMYQLMLHKIMSYDCSFRSEIKDDCLEDANSDDSSDESLYYSGDESFDRDSNGERPQNFRIHPVDCLIAVILCSDDFLRQDMFSRLAKCQIAVPFLLPDPFTKQLTLPLWAMRSIIKNWKCIVGTREVEYTHPIINYSMPIVSFIRFGKSPKRGASKSKLLNEVISDSHYDHFFHRDCKGGQIDLLIGEGLVDMCWYLPAGEPNDAFSHPVTFLNLHGDARHYTEQIKYLSQISSMCFALLAEENLEFDTHIIDYIKQFSQSPGGITMLKDIKNPPQILEEEISRMHIIDLTKKNADQIKVAIQKRIQKKMCNVQHLKSIQVCAIDSISENKILADVRGEQYEHGSGLANEILSLLSNTNYKKHSGNIKDAMLPLQGESLWKTWAMRDKESFRHVYRGNRTVNDYSATISQEKNDIRQEQLKHVIALTPVMELFISSLLKLQGSSNRRVRNYFLQCLKLELNELARNEISKLQFRYQVVRKNLAKARVKTNSTEKKSQIAEDARQIQCCREEMESLQKRIINASLGLEHLLREVGQVYEAALQFSDYNRDAELSSLPKAIAELLVDGYPVELMDGDVAHVPLQWVSAVIKEAVEMLNDPNVYVISVLGLQSTGKSTMLNASFGLQFNVNAGRCTRGAFMQLLPLDESLQREARCSYMLVVDTEGLRAPELDSQQTQKHDNELATFVIGLANVTLINIYGEVAGEMDDILQTSVHAFLRMSQVNYNPSCQFIHQNASATIHSEVSRSKFTEKLNKFTIDAAREENCEGLYETFNDIIKFDDQTDVHHFPGLWKGDPPMAPVNQGYSTAAQMLKCHLIEICKNSGFTETLGNLSLSSFQRNMCDLWNALLQENFIFSFKNTLEITAYYSLETQYKKWDWQLKEKSLKWEEDAENDINTTDPQDIPALVKKKCREVYSFISSEYETVQSEMDTYFRTSKQSEILAQWKAKFETKLKNLSEELRDHGDKRCKKIGNSRQAISKFKEERKHYTDIITAKVKEMILSLKQDQKELNENLERGRYETKQLRNILRLELFTPEKILKYIKHGIIDDSQADQINDYIQQHGGELNEEYLQELLMSKLLSAAEVKQILKQGRLNEEQLKLKFNAQWIGLVDKIPFLPDTPVDVEAAVEKVLFEFVKSFKGQLIRKLQSKNCWDATLVLEVKGKKHYEKIASSSWIGKTVQLIRNVGNNSNDPHQTEAQNITDSVLDEAKKQVDEICKRETDFNEVFTEELLRQLDRKISEHSVKVAEHFTFLQQYRLDVYLKACGYAVQEFKKMAESFRDKNDPRTYLERNIKGLLFTRFKNQYYQREAEEAIANTLCAHLEEPIQTQIRNRMGRTLVTKMKLTESHFTSKMALKVKILTDLYTKDDFESYIVHTTDIEQSFENWIKHYMFQFCNEKVSGENTRLQIATKEEISRLMGAVQNKVYNVNETDITKWLAIFCEDKDLRTDLGVKLQVDDLLTDQEEIQELNLENFKHQIMCSLRDLKNKLYASELFDVTKYESVMAEWKDKPYDLLKDLIGCTEQCPFCGEQCDLLDPEHDVTVHKHRTTVHRPSCLIGWQSVHTRVMTTDFCPASIASTKMFRNGDTNYEPHPYKDYQTIYPNWSISPDLTAKCSEYWKLFVSKYNDAIAKRFKGNPGSVPEHWFSIQWEDVEKDLKSQNYL